MCVTLSKFGYIQTLVGDLTTIDRWNWINAIVVGYTKIFT